MFVKAREIPISVNKFTPSTKYTSVRQMLVFELTNHEGIMCEMEIIFKNVLPNN